MEISTVRMTLLLHKYQCVDTWANAYGYAEKHTDKRGISVIVIHAGCRCCVRTIFSKNHGTMNYLKQVLFKGAYAG